MTLKKFCKLGFIAAVGLTLSSSAWAIPGKSGVDSNGHESQCSGKDTASKECKSKN